MFLWRVQKKINNNSSEPQLSKERLMGLAESIISVEINDGPKLSDSTKSRIKQLMLNAGINEERLHQF